TPAPPYPPTTPPVPAERISVQMAQPHEIPQSVTIDGMVIDVYETFLDLSDRNLTEADIIPLRYLFRLTHLELNGNSIIDLTQTVIPYMTNLVFLNLAHNRLTTEYHLPFAFLEDITPLANLTDMGWLWLNGNHITDISVLANMPHLIHVDLSWNPIRDISVLAGMTQLQSLFMNSTMVNDLTPIAGLTDMTNMDISGNNFSDISPLANLTRLTWLMMSRSHAVTDITPLSNLTNLDTLSIANASINDLTPLSTLTNLGWLDISDLNWFHIGPLTDLTPLSNLPHLHSLNILGHGNYITDWTPVSHVQNVFPEPPTP
ncbi:MAG: leucine-rich repeat domain-containing protein, partial [Defluviitaleaceae bacterium]|nr:leucine-rich repeat domain-containing protein [Defluviitaleaceae bacterium]